MGFLDRLRGRSEPTVVSVQAHVHTGDEDLEVVGESHYQEALWRICGGQPGGERVRHQVYAVLVPEESNPHDENAVAVHVDGCVVGYLSRSDAADYRVGLLDAMGRCGGHVALAAVVVGGGLRDHGPGLLGVWLMYDPADFGLGRSGSGSIPGRPAGSTGTMRTGFTEAWLTDAEDDSYDLSWFDALPDADRPAIQMLWDLLASDPDPIDRHFQFSELETRLYRSRDLYESALTEYDEACRAHDAEMDGICAAFTSKWGKVPLLETYRQMAIRQQKAKDWEAVLWWTTRGLGLYGDSAAREEAVEDLIKRRNRALVKLEPAPTKPPKVETPSISVVVTHEERPSPVPPPELEVLVCQSCRGSFERLRVRGRKPLLCPPCRSSRTN